MRSTITSLFLLGAIGCNGAKIIAEVDLDADFISASAISDLDGDNDQDLVIASFGALFVVSVDAGQFGAPLALPDAPDFSANLQAADLDGDALPELVTSDGLSFQVRENLGGLDFAAPTDLSTALNAGSFALADTSGDGLPELLGLVTNFATGGFSLGVLANNGGVFDANPLLIDISGNNFAPFLVNAGDADADGDQDIFLFGGVQAEFTNEQVLLLVINNGDGTFSEGADVIELGASSINGTPTQVSLGDFDNDGDADLTFAGSDLDFTPALFLLRNDDGDFIKVELPKSGNTTAARFVDVDNDEDVDIVTTTSEDEVFGYQTESIEVFVNDTEFTREAHQIRDIDGMNLLGGLDLNEDQRPEIAVVGNIDFLTSTLFAVELR